MAMMKKQTRANDNIAEDHLRKTLGRTQPAYVKTSDNGLLPKPKHSCFGNFPGGDKKSAALKVEPLKPQAEAEMSGADARQTKRKSLYLNCDKLQFSLKLSKFNISSINAF